jgi:hypothetical protein
MRRTRQFRAALLVMTLVLAPLSAVAHPGWGVVRDSRGNVFYTDLHQIWRIDAQGLKSVAVPNVHSHELYLDADDNLFGEHLWYEGDATKRWGHFLWKLSADGRYSQITPRLEGFRTEESLVRDGAGNQYWRVGTTVKTKTPSGQVSTLTTLDAAAGPNEGNIVAATRAGVLYTQVNGTLFRIEPDGRSRVLARNLNRRTLTARHVQPWHTILGLCPDAQGNVYVAVTGARVVNKVGIDGETTVFLRAPIGWLPSGVLVANDGDVYVLESRDVGDEARVRRVAKDGSVTVLP